MLLSPNHA